MQRPGAAEGDQREVARVEALLHRDQPQPAEHVLVDDVDDPGGGGLRGLQPHRLGDLADGGARGVDVEGDLAAGQRRRQVAEDDVGVGDGRLGAALAVGGRAGVGAGRLRADPQRLGQLGHVRDRAAAGADGAHVDAGGAHGEVADLGLPADPRGQVLHQGDVGGGAAHVEGDQVAVAALLGDPHRAGDPAGRAGQQHGDRGARSPRRPTAGRRRCAGSPARRRPRPRASLSDSVCDVPLHLRLHVAVGDGGERALVLAHLGQHVGGQRHRDAGQHLGGDLGDPPLVRGVGEGVDQETASAWMPWPAQLGQLGADVVLVELADRRSRRWRSARRPRRCSPARPAARAWAR